MIWLWPFVWLGIIAVAILGVVKLGLTIWACVEQGKEWYRDAHDSPVDIKWRDRWLVEHFGQEGARLWLINRDANVAMCQGRSTTNASLAGENVYSHELRWKAKLDRMVLSYPWLIGKKCSSTCSRMRGLPDYGSVCRASNGRTMGIVNGNFGGQMEGKPKWGYGFRPYAAAHAPADVHVADQDLVPPWVPYHGEPDGCDWMAAGFYDKGIEVMILDVAKEGRSGYAGCNLDPDEYKRVLDAGYALKEQREKDRVAEELAREAWTEVNGKLVRTGPRTDLRNDPRFNREKAVPWRGA